MTVMIIVGGMEREMETGKPYLKSPDVQNREKM